SITAYGFIALNFTPTRQQVKSDFAPACGNSTFPGGQAQGSLTMAGVSMISKETVSPDSKPMATTVTCPPRGIRNVSEYSRTSPGWNNSVFKAHSLQILRSPGRDGNTQPVALLRL